MPITLAVANGKRFRVDTATALIGRDNSCAIALPEAVNLEPVHAKIRNVANRWLVESQGSWPIQVGSGSPGKMSWLKPGDVIRLTEAGPEIVFEPADSLSPAKAKIGPPPLPPRLPKACREEEG
jgi:pSer/pThr/pTyr-binding forkhead associated (FHA) protein